MSRKKLITLITSICMIGLLDGCNNRKEYSKTSSSDNTSVIDNQENKMTQLKYLSENENIEIGRDLYDKYINENRTDWQMVKSQNLNRQPVVCLTDYRINDVSFVKEESDKFTVDISYDIQYTDESNFWIAGNGELTDNNWVINKCSFVDIQKIGDKYFIVNLYTG